MQSGVYQIVNKVNGNQYIGSAVNLERRFADHKNGLRGKRHFNRHLQSAWNKYGESAFEFKILLICDKKDATFYEQLAIDGFRPEYNICTIAGSTLGVKRAPEIVEKTASKKRGIALRSEHKAKISAKLKGRFFSEETKAKITAATMGRVISPECRRKISEGNKGKVVSDSTKEKLKIARVGRQPSLGMRHSEETRAKLSAQQRAKPNFLGKKHSEATKHAIRQKALTRFENYDNRLKLRKAKAKASDEQVRQVRRLSELGMSVPKIVLQVGLTRSIVSDIKLKRSYEWVT